MATIEKYLIHLINAIIVFCLASMMIMVFVNVVLRYGFNSGITFSEEVSRLFFVWMTFLGAIVAMKDGSHIRVDSLVNKLSPLGQKICAIVGNGLIIYVCSLLLEGGWKQTVINVHTASPVTGWPMAGLYVTSVIASIGIALYAIRNIIQQFTQTKSQLPGEHNL